APYRDIKMGCVGSVFLEWQNTYLEVMKRTTLTLSSMALQDYGTFMVNVDASQRALNTGRWGMVDRIRQEIDERRAQVSGYPQGIRGLTFSGEAIHRDTLITNLVPCMDAEFGKLIDEDVPQPDLSRLDKRAYKVTWKQSTAGGIEAEWIEVEGGGDQRLFLFGIGRSSIHETIWNALTTGNSR
ncbi:MAG TPA: hypothetical protein VM598_02515, partial [Bdellovibrionota bacterium]|nr:hypothetical protein [Bdellovibrionota bacterium]